MTKDSPTLPHKLHIGIYGAGSIGCYLAGCFSQSGYNLTCIGRKTTQDIIQEHGLNISDWKNNSFAIDNVTINNVTINNNAIVFSSNAEDIHSADIIFVTVKNRDCELAARELLSVIRPQTIIVCLQNGVRAGGIFKSIMTKHTVLNGTVAFNVINKGQGHFHCGTEGDLIIQQHELIEQLLCNPLCASFNIKLHPNIVAVQWTKLIMNLNNAVNALSGEPLTQQLHDHNYRHIMAALINEALIILQSSGIKTQRLGNIIPPLLPFILRLPNWAFKRVAKTMLNIDPQARSSMYEDLLNHRPTEVDYLNGEIITLAKQQGLEAPLNKRIVALIKAAESKNQGSPRLNAHELLP